MKIEDLFPADHQRIDEILERLMRHEDETSSFAELQQALMRHIFWEEEFLFPKVEELGLSDPPRIMRIEHSQICRLLGEFERALRSGQSIRPDRLQGLKRLLIAHNSKEERALYPMVDSMLGQESLSELLQKIIDSKMPSGWECLLLRQKSIRNFQSPFESTS